MKRIAARKIVAMAVAVFTAVMLLGSCTLTRRTEALPKTNLKALEDDIREAQSQVEATRDSILDLETGQEFEVHDLFADYLATAALMERSREQLSRHLEQLRVQGVDYFTEWSKHNGAYTNPKIRMLTRDQVNDLSDQFGGIPAEGEKARRALAPFAFDVEQLREMAPVTPRKIDFLDFLINKTESDGDSLTDALDTLLAQIKQARQQLAQIPIPQPTAGMMEQAAPGGPSQPVPQEIPTAEPSPAPQPETMPEPPPAPEPSATPEQAPPLMPEPPPPPEPQAAPAHPGFRRMEQR